MWAYFHSDHAVPPFSDSELQPFQTDLETFLNSRGQEVDWSIREEQPMRLKLMNALRLIMKDADASLFDCLLAGVPTGFSNNIPPSGVFPPRASQDPPSTPLSVHWQNWFSAESHPDLTAELVEEEIAQGWVTPFSGTLEDAQQQYPLGVSVGKLGIAFSETRAPRLVVDSSICGLNNRCNIPEHTTVPTAKKM